MKILSLLIMVNNVKSEFDFVMKDPDESIDFDIILKFQRMFIILNILLGKFIYLVFISNLSWFFIRKFCFEHENVLDTHHNCGISCQFTEN